MRSAEPESFDPEPDTCYPPAEFGRLYGSSARLLLSGFTSFELSLQSSLQLSLTVLVCYRFRGRI